MIRKLLIILLLALSLPATAQKNKERKLTIHDSILQHYITANPRLKFIRFERNVYRNIRLFPDTSATGAYLVPNGNTYDMGYLGHHHLMEKRFGKFPYEALKALVDSLNSRVCDQTSFTGIITARSLSIKVMPHCPSDNEDMMFFKVPMDAEYPGGEKAFTKHIQTWLNQTSGFVFPDKDTVLLLKMIVRKQGTIDGIEFIDSLSAPVNKAIRSALLNSEKWYPAMQGGNWVHSYTDVFIRLRKDGTIEADYY